eukprot:366548-Chlamydomonas_euryale.AAC.15
MKDLLGGLRLGTWVGWAQAAQGGGGGTRFGWASAARGERECGYAPGSVTGDPTPLASTTRANLAKISNRLPERMIIRLDGSPNSGVADAAVRITHPWHPHPQLRCPKWGWEEPPLLRRLFTRGGQPTTT